MEWFLATLQIAIGAGLATTFDDNIYLTGFFGEVDRKFRPKHVVVGELIGFSVLLLLSLLGYGLGAAIPGNTIGFLGLLPIAIGVANLAELLRDYRAGLDQPRLLASQLPARQQGFASRRISLLAVLGDRRTYSVSLVTISNGSNNLTIYISLFISLSLNKIMVVIPVLYGCVITWLFLSYNLTRMPGLSIVLNRYARIIFPFILMWLGWRILNDSGASEAMGATLSHWRP